MKIITTSDFHIADSYSYSTSINPFEDFFFKQNLNAAKQVIDYALKEDALIINAGDITHQETFSSPVYFAITYLFNLIKRYDLKMVLNSGNHEIEYLIDEKKRIPNLMSLITSNHYAQNIISRSEKWWMYEYSGLNIYVIPYYKHEIFLDVLYGMLDKIKEPACLCIHQNIKGIKFGNNNVIKSGLSNEEIMKLEGKFKFIVCGHLHCANSFQTKQTSVLIPGSLTSFDFNDENSIKSFYEITLREFNVVNVKTIPIKNQPFFYTIYLQTFDKAQNIIIKNNIFKIQYTIDEQKEFNILKNQMIENGALKVIPDIIIRKEKTDLFAQKRDITMNIDDWLKEYMKNVGIDEEEQNVILEYNSKLMEKA